MNDNHISKINKFFKKELLTTIPDVGIIKNDDGTYELFDKYVITKKEEYYVLTMKYTFTEKTFSSLKNAVTWCIFDKRNKINILTRIEELDRMIIGSDISINIHKRLIDKCVDKDQKLIYVAKLSQEQLKKKKYTSELLSFIADSKDWQSQRFAIRTQK